MAILVLHRRHQLQLKSRNHLWTRNRLSRFPYCISRAEANSYGRALKKNKIFLVTMSLSKEENRNVDQEGVRVSEEARNIQRCLIQLQSLSAESRRAASASRRNFSGHPTVPCLPGLIRTQRARGSRIALRLLRALTGCNKFSEVAAVCFQFYGKGLGKIPGRR